MSLNSRQPWAKEIEICPPAQAGCPSVSDFISERHFPNPKIVALSLPGLRGSARDGGCQSVSETIESHAIPSPGVRSGMTCPRPHWGERNATELKANAWCYGLHVYVHPQPPRSYVEALTLP